MFSSNSPSVRPVGVPAVAAQRGAPATPVRARHDRGQLVRRLALCGVALLGVVSCAIAFRDVDSGKLLAAGVLPPFRGVDFLKAGLMRVFRDDADGNPFIDIWRLSIPSLAGRKAGR